MRKQIKRTCSAMSRDGRVIGEGPITRNPIAKALASDLFRKRIVESRKGKGSYKRKEKHRQRG